MVAAEDFFQELLTKPGLAPDLLPFGRAIGDRRGVPVPFLLGPLRSRASSLIGILPLVVKKGQLGPNR